MSWRGPDLLDAISPEELAFGVVDPRLDMGELAEATEALEPILSLSKTQARPAEMNLRVHGVSRTPAGQRVYRMVTRDGEYVGRTNPTNVRADKGDTLTVAANHLALDEHGDIRWQNANVAGSCSDQPHSWRELEGMAGAVEKLDAAPGPAGRIPPAGDTPQVNGPPSKATVAALGAAAGDGGHVNVPLKNVSQAYVSGKRRKKKRAAGEEEVTGTLLSISKAGAMKQLVYGVVLEPNSFDSQEDFMLPHHVERTAHGYLKKAIRGQSSVAKLQHRAQGFHKTQPSIVPVESFIAPVDFSYDGMEMIKAGSWVICMHVEDAALWQRFLDGEFQAFSVGGTGVRQSLHTPLVY